MYIIKKILWVFMLITVLEACNMDEKIVLGEVSFPLKDRVEFSFNVSEERNYAIYLSSADLMPEIPDSILAFCKTSNDDLCIIEQLYGNLDWKIYHNGEIVKSGNYRTVDNSHPKIMILDYFKGRPGNYKLEIERALEAHQDSPLIKKVISVE